MIIWNKKEKQMKTKKFILLFQAWGQEEKIFLVNSWGKSKKNYLDENDLKAIV
jgi:hypothetical protein